MQLGADKNIKCTVDLLFMIATVILMQTSLLRESCDIRGVATSPPITIKKKERKENKQYVPLYKWLTSSEQRLVVGFDQKSAIQVHHNRWEIRELMIMKE